MARMSKIRKLADTYLSIKFEVLDAGYSQEISWQESVGIEDLTEDIFLKEIAWVITSSGISYHVVSKVFPKFTEAFYDWDIHKILQDTEACFNNSYIHFKNEKKIRAIIYIAEFISNFGLENLISRLNERDFSFIYNLPYMGPATTLHLLKNLGISTAKPDRHLNRITHHIGYNDPNELCSDISCFTGDKVNVVDLVLWRFATLNRSYLEYFSV